MNENQNDGPDVGEQTNEHTNQDQQYSNQQQYQQQNNQQQYQQPPFNAQVPPQGYAAKSKVAAGLLGIFLGCFGVHNFYLGFTGKAIAQLLITVLTCGFGAAITSIWGIIEGILILTANPSYDANGVPLI